MSHYFIEDNSLKHNIRKISYSFAGQDFTFTTDAGVFSNEHVDQASDILLNTLPPLTGSLLDLGCGYGCIGIVLAKTNAVELTQADINQKALDLTKLNCEANRVSSKVIKSDCFGNIPGEFDNIVLNPPIHAGKAVTYRMYEESHKHLKKGGSIYIVTLKKHGAESTLDKLAEIFGNCDTIYKKKGYYVFHCVK